MCLFRTYSGQKYVRMLFFLILALTCVNMRACSEGLAYGFPTVYYESYESIAPLNIVINIIAMVLLFFALEFFRLKSKDIDLFDKSLFTTLIYLMLGLPLLTLAKIFSEDFFGIVYIIIYFPVLFVGALFEGIPSYIAAHYLFPNGDDFIFRVGLIVFSPILFFIIYYGVKLKRRILGNKD